MQVRRRWARWLRAPETLAGLTTADHGQDGEPSQDAHDPQQWVPSASTLHPYGAWPQNWDRPEGWGFGPLSASFAMYGDYNLPLYVTEAGAPSAEVGAELQATYLTALLAEATPKCESVIWYQLQHYGNPLEGLVSLGLRDLQGGSKPTLRAFEALATRVPQAPTSPATSEDFEARHAAKLGSRWEPRVSAKSKWT